MALRRALGQTQCGDVIRISSPQQPIKQPGDREVADRNNSEQGNKAD
jgi:hypothetical protein